MLKRLKEKLDRVVTPSFSLEREIVGIDLSHNYLRVVQLTNKKDDWSITRLATAVCTDRQMNENERYLEIADLLSGIKKQQNFDTYNAAISLPINDAIVQIVQIPFLDDELLSTAVQNGSLWQNAISLPGDLSEYSIFWQVIKSDADAGTMSILFVASSLSKVDKLCKAVKDAGFNPVFVDVRCFALRNISKLYDNETADSSVYLEISGYENYMVGVHNDMPFIYDIFVTDADVSALISGAGMLDNSAYSRIASQVKETLGMFVKQTGIESIKEVSLVSSLTHVESIHQGLAEHLGSFAVVVLEPFKELKVSSKIKAQLPKLSNLSAFSVALGLATRRLDLLNKTLVKAVANINLLPNRDDFIERETKSSTSQMKSARIASYFLVLMMLFGIVYVAMVLTLPSEKQVNELESSNQALKAKVDQLQLVFKDYSFWFNEVEVKNRKLIDLKVLDEIPNGVYVLDFKQVRDGFSEVSFQSTNPALISDIMDKMSKKYKNVKLISVESDSENTYQISKVTFEIK